MPRCLSGRALATAVAIVAFGASERAADLKGEPAADPKVGATHSIANGKSQITNGPLTSYVNPFIGTGGHGHTFPGPSLPFGMIQPGPDTRLTGWDGCSGYHYDDTRIYGFSHTHLSGTGISDYGDILLMPTTGPLRLNNGADGRPGYASQFSHDQETAAPGYYAVTLQDYGIRAELTTTTRVGMHRDTFPAGAPAHVVLDLEHRDQVTDSAVDVVSDTEVTGYRRSTGWAKDQIVYFDLRFSRPFTFPGVAVDEHIQPGLRRARGTRLKAGFDFGTGGGVLLVKVGISAVSADGARGNVDAELPGWDFDAVRRAADAAWQGELDRILVTGGTHDQRVTFYTALYHAMLAPNIYMDVDGQYRGRDGQVHHADGFTYYTVFSLWDTFRALHPLLTIIDPQRTRDFIQTFLRQYQEGGRLPVWELAGNETDTMIGYHAVPVIADAIAKGVGGFDEGLALQAMEHSADEDRNGLASDVQHGFVDAGDASESVSRTLEYAYDDWTIAQVAKRLGREDDYARFIRRAQSDKNLFDPGTGFMRARVDGLWFAPFDPAEVNNNYTEANAWQYSFFVPQDVDGLIALLGGPDAFARKLDGLFAASSQTTGRDQADITGMIGQYAHGNEPSHHVAYLYDYAGQPWKTQAMVRRILDTFYGNRPDGLIGNDDCGQMSAWYVLSALGFYPVTPGSTEYVIGAPLFDAATIQLPTGRTFVIRADDQSPANVYIQSARLNGAARDQTFFDHATLTAGGELAFVMGPSPNTTWGAAPASRPISSIAGDPIVPVPFVAEGTRMFRGTQTVTLGDADPAAEIRYTLDGSTPGPSSPRYGAPIRVDETSTLRAVALRAGETSHELTAAFRRVPDYPRLTLSARYRPQYSAGGDLALIDGLRGGTDFRVGRWQGYLGTDLDATLDFGQPRAIHHVAMGFLQDTGAWILMPRSVTIEVSDDGHAFRSIGTIQNTVPERDMEPLTRDFGMDVSVTARYVRLHVERYGMLPDWHPGAGNPAFFFTDEIVVR